MTSILIIDDDDFVREMLRFMLEQAGYEVFEASDGEMGLNIYRERPMDLIITDLIMPEKEGIETIIEFKRDFPEVKIIAISGGGMIDSETYLNMAKKFGVQTLSKPIDRNELLETVRKLH